MQDDSVRYWQDLTDNYRRMGDGELLELAAKPEDLTDVAQQVLRDEMRLRKLSALAPEPATPSGPKRHADIRWEPTSYRYEFADNVAEEESGPHEFTWKTKLCDCETRLQAMQLAAALQRTGIDSWIQASGGKSDAFDLTYPRVFVAADQLEQAQVVAAQPIPQDIIDKLLEDQESEPEEFEAPRCPKCGAEDPVLCPAEESEIRNSRPDDKGWMNTWLCESCGAEWTDAEETTDGSMTPP
jgi:hypothetical protein